MQTVGVICEYNPFHLGHARQFAAIRHQLGQDAAIVCLMSGNYVQRGEPAVFDKLTRARAAADAGAEILIVSQFTLWADAVAPPRLHRRGAARDSHPAL